MMLECKGFNRGNFGNVPALVLGLSEYNFHLSNRYRSSLYLLKKRTPQLSPPHRPPTVIRVY